VINKGAVVPAGASEPASETRSLETWVLSRDGGRWRVVAFQNSPESPAAAPRDPVKELYLEWTATRIRGEQPDPEAWGDLTAEPRGVDYIETEATGLPAIWAVPKECAEDRVLLCMHGGGFVAGSIYTHRKMFGHLAKAAGARALMFDYRLAPTYTHPAEVDDVTGVYRWLLEQRIEAHRVAFAGEPSGGGLAVTCQLRAREHGLPLPAAAALISPWFDMEVSGESYRSNWAAGWPFALVAIIRYCPGTRRSRSSCSRRLPALGEAIGGGRRRGRFRPRDRAAAPRAARTLLSHARGSARRARIPRLRRSWPVRACPGSSRAPTRWFCRTRAMTRLRSSPFVRACVWR
jgi:hypothetical protein